MSLKENVTQSVTLFAAILPAFVLGFGGMWLGMQSIASDIRADIRAEIGQMRTEMRHELGQMRGTISNLAERVARIEGHLRIPPPPPSDRAATDPANPPTPDTSDRPTVDG